MAFNKRPDIMSRLMTTKIIEYKYEVIYKAKKINANTDALSRNPTPVSPLKISEKINTMKLSSYYLLSS